LELLIQAVEVGTGVRSGYSLKDIGVAALAGATGVGAARLISRAGSIGNLGRAVANRVADAAVSAGPQAAQNGDVSLASVISLARGARVEKTAAVLAMCGVAMSLTIVGLGFGMVLLLATGVYLVVDALILRFR
jgi:hypothetical protein